MGNYRHLSLKERNNEKVLCVLATSERAEKSKCRVSPRLALHRSRHAVGSASLRDFQLENIGELARILWRAHNWCILFSKCALKMAACAGERECSRTRRILLGTCEACRKRVTMRWKKAFVEEESWPKFELAPFANVPVVALKGRAVGMALVFRLPAFGLIGIELSTPSRLKKCSESLRYTANKTSRLGVLPRELHVTMLRKLAHSCMSDAPVDNLSARICLPQHSNGVPG